MDNKNFLKLTNGYKPSNKKEEEYLKTLLEEGFLKFNSEKEYILDSKYKIGIVEFKKKFAILNDNLNRHRNLILEFENLNGAFNGDLVIVRRVFNPRASNLSKVVKILNSQTKELFIFSKDDRFFTIKEGILVDNITLKDYKNGDVFLYDYQKNSIIEHFGNLENAVIDEKISLYLYGEDYRTKEKIEEINLDDFDLEDISSRVDLRELPFCTIDPATAKDHDDAIYYDEKEQTLYVAIADVSYFVKEDSTLDELVLKKSTSIYLPNKVLPMLPPILSENLCSLKEDEVRFAYVFKLVFDLENICVKSSQYFEAVIKSHKNLSYGRVNRVLNGKFDQYNKIEKGIFDYLVALFDITKKFRDKRLKKGYDFRSLEYRQHLNSDYELESISIEESDMSHKLVEECMLLANVEASKSANEVAIYRIHEEPTFDNIAKIVDLVSSLGIKTKLKENIRDTILSIQQKAKHSLFAKEVDELIIQAQTQAYYSSKNLGHFGLGFNSYSHFTSPIRRYSDLVLHRILKSKKTPKNIDEICEHISNTQRKVDLLVWDFEDRKYARWARKQIGEEFQAYICDDQKGIAKLYKNMYGLRVVLDNYKAQILFSKIKIIIKDVDIVSKIITASIKY